MNTTLAIYRRPGSVKVTCKKSGAFVFLYTTGRGTLAAVGYAPKATRNSAFNYTFKDEARRSEYVAKFFASYVARAERNAADKARRSKPHTRQAGHVLRTCWGYEQTNVEFFQVVRVVGKNSVEVRELSQIAEETGVTYGRTLPRMDAFTGETLLRRVNMRGEPSVKIDNVRTAWLWDGKSASYSWGH